MKQVLQEVQEHQLALALERRKAAEEKADNRKAAEALQQVGFLFVQSCLCCVAWLG